MMNSENINPIEYKPGLNGSRMEQRDTESLRSFGPISDSEVNVMRRGQGMCGTVRHPHKDVVLRNDAKGHGGADLSSLKNAISLLKNGPLRQPQGHDRGAHEQVQQDKTVSVSTMNKREYYRSTMERKTEHALENMLGNARGAAEANAGGAAEANAGGAAEANRKVLRIGSQKSLNQEPTSPQNTMYDGDDVVMEDAMTPSGGLNAENAYTEKENAYTEKENAYTEKNNAVESSGIEQEAPCLAPQYAQNQVLNPEVHDGNSSPVTPGLETSKHQDAGHVHTALKGGEDAASEGKKLARRLRDVAEKLGTPKLSPYAHTPAFGGQGKETHVLGSSVDIGRRSQLGVGEKARELASASTEERPKPVPRRMSLLYDATMLDLGGFDVQGDVRRKSISTPVIQGQSLVSRLSPRHGTTVAQEDISVLKQKIEELETQNEEAGVILEGYQGSIAKLQDELSKQTIASNAELSLLRTEAERLRKERADVHRQFETLYRDKYLPLKSEVVTLRDEVNQMHINLKEAKSKCEEIDMLRKELEASRNAAMAARKAAEAAEAVNHAAQEAQRLAEEKADAALAQNAKEIENLKYQYEVRLKNMQSSLDTKTAELAESSKRMVLLRNKLDETMHKSEVAIAGRDRKQAELNSKEDEICALQVRLKDIEAVLASYKAENEKFFSVRLKYKATIANLEHQVDVLQSDKAELTKMCDELLSEAEKK